MTNTLEGSVAELQEKLSKLENRVDYILSLAADWSVSGRAHGITLSHAIRELAERVTMLEDNK